MKKLIIAAVAVAVSVAVNAATCTWSASAIALAPDAGTGTSTSSYMAYFFDTLDTSVTDVTTALSKGDTSVLADALGTKAPGSTGSVLQGKATGDWAQGDKVTAFMVVINNADPDKATYFLASDPKTSATGVSSQGTVTLGFGSQAGATWKTMSVPEPTSAVLILLGMAGLALRRRCA